MKKVSFSTIFVFALVLILSACGSTPTTETGKATKGELDGAPKWVKNPSFEADKDEVCGVGSAGGSKNISQLQNAARGRGRTEISRMLELKVQSMLKDYQSTTTGGEDFGNAANDEQHIVDVAKQITDNTLNGTEQKNLWQSNSGNVYMQMCLNAEKFKGIVSGMTQLSETIRKAVIERADQAFDELAKEVEKNRAE